MEPVVLLVPVLNLCGSITSNTYIFCWLFPWFVDKGSYVQQSAKKPKIMKQLLDNTYDNIMSMSGSIPYPMTSQMSNMSNQNKLMRYIDGDDRSRKAKVLKVSFVAAWLKVWFKSMWWTDWHPIDVCYNCSLSRIFLCVILFLQVSSLHLGPGSPWSLFEDQVEPF